MRDPSSSLKLENGTFGQSPHPGPRPKDPQPASCSLEAPGGVPGVGVRRLFLRAGRGWTGPPSGGGKTGKMGAHAVFSKAPVGGAVEV